MPVLALVAGAIVAIVGAGMAGGIGCGSTGSGCGFGGATSGLDCGFGSIFFTGFGFGSGLG